MKRFKLPLDCKTAKLKSLYRKGSKRNPKNYRPVSLLSFISKVIEKVIHNQIEHFLSNNKILCKYQPICSQCSLFLSPENSLMFSEGRERAHWEEMG